MCFHFPYLRVAGPARVPHPEVAGRECLMSYIFTYIHIRCIQWPLT